MRGFEPGKKYLNDLPVTTLASDSVAFPVEGVAAAVEPQKSAIADLWQRWNDYGIGLFLEGEGKSEPKQAEQAFLEVERLGRFDGPLNLARVYLREGRIDDAVEALNRAQQFDNPPAFPWTIAWFTGLANKQQGNLDEAIKNFRSTLYDQTPERLNRRFDFTLDYVVHDELGQTLFERAKQERGEERKAARAELYKQAVKEFEASLKLDAEDVAAHYGLSQLYKLLGNDAKAAEHAEAHARYKPDDKAQGLAINQARNKSPTANHAVEKLVIYSLHRRGAPGLPDDAAASGAIGGGQ